MGERTQTGFLMSSDGRTGGLPLGLAPMAGFSCAPWRLIARDFGAGYAVTEMVKANLYLQGHRDTTVHTRRVPGEGPVGLQIAGADPQQCAEAAARAEAEGFAACDLNAGCAIRRMRGVNAGSALMDDPAHLGRIVAAMVQAVRRLPITVKLRSGPAPGRLTAVACARAARDAGAAMLCLHPRTATQRMQGRADWSVIAQVRQAVDVPLYGNGDITTADDAVAMVDRTGCDGVMIGRAALGDPWLLQAIEARLSGRSAPSAPAPQDVFAVARRHYGLLSDFLGSKRATLMFRKLGALYAERAGVGLQRVAAIKQASDRERMLALLRPGKSDR